MTKRIMLVYGTRPEAIKMAPVFFELERSDRLAPVVVLTGQHRSMLNQVNHDFQINSDHDLEIMQGRPDAAGHHNSLSGWHLRAHSSRKAGRRFGSG